MDWTQTLTIIGSLAGFFIYSITRMDSKLSKIDSKLEASKFDIKSDLKDLKDELRGEIKSLRSEVKDDLRDIKSDMRDFKIEVNQRLSTIESALMPRKVYHFEESSKHDEEPKEN
jgi:hypothetical protein